MLNKLTGNLHISRTLFFGAFILLMLIIIVVLAPVLTPFDPIEQDIINRFASPSLQHPFGTDNFGRDIFSRILYGGRVDLEIAFLATFLSLAVGTIIGLVSGYFGGWLDSILMSVINLTLAFPQLVLVIAILAMLGPSLLNMYIAIVVISWVSYARLIRSEVLVIRNMEYIQAARALGSSNIRIIFKHILPNAISSSIVLAASDAVLNMIFAGTLGYLGLGIQPPNPEWGAMVAEGRVFISSNPSMVIIPGFSIVVAGIAFSLIGDGLADKLRK